MQAKRKEDFYNKLLEDHGIQVGGMVLLYDNHHKECGSMIINLERYSFPFRVLSTLYVAYLEFFLR